MQPGKPVSESMHEATHLVMPGDTNPHGAAFGGQVVAWIDLAGAVAAMRHARSAVVTAAIDELQFISKIRLGHLVLLKAAVNLAGRTSMEVGVRVDSEDPTTGVRSHACSAYLTFVAVDEAGAPREVPPLMLETDEDRRRCREAEARRAHRLQSRMKARP
ncbi:MAG: acyl-CoA thioesterase [Candidatus Riflebacteria bacterium]|nr:acyl-CoA thioesterase [Candidatus Riflebacteria bacterium]